VTRSAASEGGGVLGLDRVDERVSLR